MVALCLIALVCSCEEAAQPTQLLVVIHSNLLVGTQLTRLTAHVTDPSQPLHQLLPDQAVVSNREWVLRAPEQAGPGKTIPLSFGIVPQGDDAARRLRLIVTGFAPVGPGGEEQAVIQQVVKTGFRKGEKLLLEVFLWDTCYQNLCLSERAQASDRVCEVATGACGEAPTLVLSKAPANPIRLNATPPGLMSIPAGDGGLVGPGPGPGPMTFDAGGPANPPGDAGRDGGVVDTNPCEAPKRMCGSECVDPTDPRHCGSCDRDCTALPQVQSDRVTCSEQGICVVPPDACTSGYAHCTTDVMDGCETAISSASDCGACGNACPAGMPLCTDVSGGLATPMYQCVTDCADPNPTQCGSECVNTDTSASHCMDCGHACDPVARGQAVCSGGTCDFTCNPNNHRCGDTCLPDDSVDSCGTLCAPCPAPIDGNATCNGVSCGYSCPGGRHLCTDRCEPNDSVATCGTMCSPCSPPANADATCDGVSCGFTCRSGYKLCAGACVANAACCSDADCATGLSCISGSCQSYCDQRSAPTGVLASDWQCLDFDRSATLPWPATTQSATAATTTSPAYSLPRSFESSYSGAAGATRGTIAWTATGPTNITKMTVSMRVNPERLATPTPPFSGRIDLLCLTSSGFKECLSYTNLDTLYPITGSPISNYTGYFVHIELTGGAAFLYDCQLSGSLTWNSWNTVQFDAVNNGAVRFNGTNVGQCADEVSDTAATVAVGLWQNGSTAAGWGVYYDNIEVTVER